MSILKTTQGISCKMLIASAVTAFTLAWCATKPEKPEGIESLREKLTQLQSDPRYVNKAPVALQEAEKAVIQAEKPRENADSDTAQHLVYLAEQRLAIAQAVAEREYLEEQREKMDEQRMNVRLNAREQELQALRSQMQGMNPRATDQGLMLTLGDVLFATGQAQLKPGAANNLAKLLSFLKQNPESSITIEGHTDSVGDEQMNQSLSQRRAEAVKAYLVSSGVQPDRINAVGRGEAFPVADNASNTGRQLNRRVEVIIADTYEN